MKLRIITDSGDRVINGDRDEGGAVAIGPLVDEVRMEIEVRVVQ